MAHEIYEINGEASMAFTGKTPWHGLGQQLEPDVDLETWKKRAHLNWTINKFPVIYNANGNLKTYADRMVLARNYDDYPLSIVSKDYKPVQPSQLIDFYKNLIDRHGFKMETAGSLKEGRRIWALASTGREGSVNGDKIRPFLLFMTACDGTLATRVTYTAVRVVCNNTLEMADRESQDATMVVINHRKEFSAYQAQLELGLLDDRFSRFLEEAGAMQQFKVTERQLTKYFLDLLHNPKNGDDYSDVPERTLNHIERAWEEEQQQTLWGAVNAVTRYADFYGNEHQPGNKLFSSWCGTRRNLKNKAWKKAEALVYG